MRLPSSQRWGTEWLTAFAESDERAARQLRAGRNMVRKGQVQNVSIDKGAIHATVVSAPSDTVSVEIQPLSDGDIDLLTEQLAANAKVVASLLEGRVDPVVIDLARNMEITLFPTTRDVRSHCDCGEWAEPCKHAAAVCWAAGQRIDEDPILLLILRGLDPVRILEVHRGTDTVSSTVDDDSNSSTLPSGVVDAATFWSEHELRAEATPMPSEVRELLQSAVLRAGQAIHWHLDEPTHRSPGSRSPLDPYRDGLNVLAVDAIYRAQEFCSLDADLGLTLDSSVDAVRRLATRPNPEAQQRLLAETGLSDAELVAAVTAWRLGGADAVTMLEPRNWSTDQTELSLAREVLVESGWNRRAIGLSYNCLQLQGFRIALSSANRWYRFEEKGYPAVLHISSGPDDDVIATVHDLNKNA